MPLNRNNNNLFNKQEYRILAYSVYRGESQLKSHVFIKQKKQNQICLGYAMARKNNPSKHNKTKHVIGTHKPSTSTYYQLQPHKVF